MVPIPPAFVEATKKVVGLLLSASYEKISEGKKNDYEIEFLNILNLTIDEFQQSHPVPKAERIPFYQSQLLLDEFLKLRFTKALDLVSIQHKFQTDQRIIPPSSNDLKAFLKILDKYISKSDQIRELNFEYNFKREIFELSDILENLDKKFDEHVKFLEQKLLDEQVPDIEFNVFAQKRFPNSKDLALGLFLEITNHSKTITVNKIKVIVYSEPVGDYKGFGTLFTTFGDLQPGEKQRFEAIHEYEKIINECLPAPVKLGWLVSATDLIKTFESGDYERYPVTVSIEFLPRFTGATLIKKQEPMLLLLQRS